jgi:hypothetical protein
MLQALNHGLFSLLKLEPVLQELQGFAMSCSESMFMGRIGHDESRSPIHPKNRIDGEQM